MKTYLVTNINTKTKQSHIHPGTNIPVHIPTTIKSYTHMQTLIKKNLQNKHETTNTDIYHNQ